MPAAMFTLSRLIKSALLALAATLAFAPVSAEAQRGGRDAREAQRIERGESPGAGRRDRARDERRFRPRPQRRAPSRSEQDAAFENRQAGRAMPLRVIERRAIMQMDGADYMGSPVYFEDRNTYRMTFMRDGQVIRVEVDARSGRITDRTDR